MYDVLPKVNVGVNLARLRRHRQHRRVVIVVFGAGAHTLYVTVQLAPVVPGWVKFATPPRPSSSPPAHVVAVCVNVEPTGNLSLVETLNVPACPG